MVILSQNFIKALKPRLPSQSQCIWTRDMKLNLSCCFFRIVSLLRLEIIYSRLKVKLENRSMSDFIQNYHYKLPEKKHLKRLHMTSSGLHFNFGESSSGVKRPFCNWENTPVCSSNHQSVDKSASRRGYFVQFCTIAPLNTLVCG